MGIPITINNKEYELIDKINIDGKDYIAYEDEDTIYINAYTIENDNLNLLDITEEEKDKVVKGLDL